MSAEKLSYHHQISGSYLSSSNYHSFDVVYHGSSNAAKGLYFVLELACLTPELTFLIPDSASNVLHMTSNSPPPNVSFIEMTWETGLRESVSLARLVLNPSMWSAPIEGALIVHLTITMLPLSFLSMVTKPKCPLSATICGSLAMSQLPLPLCAIF